MRPTQPGQSALLLLDVVDLLTEGGFEYAVIGAMAASVHGAVRASLDADAVAFVTLQQVGVLERRFTEAGFTTSLRIGGIDDPISALLALEDANGNRVDLIVGLRGLDRSALERSIEVPFQGVKLRILGREDFIATKVFAGGPQDLADASAAIAVDSASIDVALVREIAGRYGREARDRLEALLSVTKRRRP